MHRSSTFKNLALAAAVILSTVCCGSIRREPPKVEVPPPHQVQGLSSSYAWLDQLGRPCLSSSFGNYGEQLRRNKRALVKALKEKGANHKELITFVAVAMQETDHMDANERDASKDSNPASANFSCLNMNADMLKRVGYDPAKGPSLNRNEDIYTVVYFALKAIRQYGINGFLAFHRAGYTGYAQFQKGGQDGYRRNDHMDIQGYINGFVTIAYQLEKDASLLNDDRRVQVYVEHR